MKINKFVVTLTIAILVFYPLLNAYGISISYYEEIPQEFNKNNIITDDDMNDYRSMSMEQIQQFLVEKGGALAHYFDPQLKMPAYWVIYNASQIYKVNPRFILTMLQKEQSLITNPDPSPNQYDWAVGYSCYGGQCMDQYKGFSTQVYSMANKFMNNYIADLKVRSKHLSNYYCTFTKWCIGFPKETQDYQLIIPENNVTAALYTYNPYMGGTRVDGLRVGANYNFWKIWNDWFEFEQIFRPTGTVVKTANSPVVYLIQNGIKRPFANFSSFITRYQVEDILVVNQKELEQYELGQPIKFAQYSLLKDSSGNKYLLVDDFLKKIVSDEVFKTLGFNPEEIEEISDQDLLTMQFGRDITMESAYPTGALIKDAKTNGVYYVESGIKYPLVAKELIKSNFPNQSILSAHTEELDKYPKGAPVKFKDGSLIKVKDDPVVYFISDGQKLPIKDGDAFLSRGYDWAKVIETNQQAVDIHPTGETLEKLDLSALITDDETASTTSEL